MQGLVVVSLIFEEIPNINIKCVKVTGVHNIGQGHRVKVPVESVHREEMLNYSVSSVDSSAVVQVPVYLIVSSTVENVIKEKKHTKIYYLSTGSWQTENLGLTNKRHKVTRNECQ